MQNIISAVQYFNNFFFYVMMFKKSTYAGQITLSIFCAESLSHIQETEQANFKMYNLFLISGDLLYCLLSNKIILLRS